MEFWVVLGGSGNRKTDLGGFRQRKNGQQWKKTANTDVFKGFGMLEYWTHCKNQCFGPTLYWRTRKLCCFWRKDWNNTLRTCVLDRLYAQECINYVGVEGKQSKNTAKKIWSMFNIFTRTEPKNLRCGRPPTRSGVNIIKQPDFCTCLYSVFGLLPASAGQRFQLVGNLLPGVFQDGIWTSVWIEVLLSLSWRHFHFTWASDICKWSCQAALLCQTRRKWTLKKEKSETGLAPAKLSPWLPRFQSVFVGALASM